MSGREAHYCAKSLDRWLGRVRERCLPWGACVPGRVNFDTLYEDLALTHTNLRPNGAGSRAATVGEALQGRDLRFWRAVTRGDYRLRIPDMLKLALLSIAGAAVFFAGQSFVTRVRYFEPTAATSHPAPSMVAIGKTVPHPAGLAPAAPLSAYRAEMQLDAGALLNRWNPLVEAASKRFGVPPNWIRAVMRMESGGRTMLSETQPMTSRAGAVGLMQIMPDTYRDMHAQLGLGTNVYDPHDNVFAGTAYLKWLHERYGFPAMFAAYNDGPGHYEGRLAAGVPLPAETQNYVGRIAATLGGGAPGGSTIELTRPNGERIALLPSAVSSVRAALPGEYAPGVNAVVTIGRARQGVRENVTTVDAILQEHAGARVARRISSHHLHLAEFGHRISVSYLLRG
jgi:soluble lytic murein transglycosylase-like protein